jgi:acyl-coenzyme A thioesterase PaaI-like protein
VLTVEYKINLLAPAVGDHIEAIGTVLKSGRTLTVRRLEVFGVQDGRRSLVANGQQTLIRIGADGVGERKVTPRSPGGSGLDPDVSA